MIDRARAVTFGGLLRRPWMRAHASDPQVQDETVRAVACDILLGLEQGHSIDEAVTEATRANNALLRSQYGEKVRRQVPLELVDQVIGIDIDFDQVEHSERGLNTFAILQEVATPRQQELMTALADLGSTKEVGDMFGIRKQSVESARQQVRAKFEREVTA